MNTCQTSMKNSILLMYLGCHEQRYETSQVKITKLRGESQADEQASFTQRNYGNYHNIILVRIVY